MNLDRSALQDFVWLASGLPYVRVKALDAMNFNIKQRDVELESTFSPRLWSLVHNVPVLYEALLERLAHVGLSDLDLRPEAGNGSVGTAGLGFWLFGSKVNVQLRLDSFRFRTSLLASNVLDSADGVVAAIRQASPDEFRFRTHAVSYACHGLIEGMKAAEFVGGIVRNAPVIEGFGDHIGTGVAFYFGEAPPTISSTLTMDASREVPDGLFVKVIVVMDGAVGTIPEIRALAEERVRTALSSVNLDIP